MVWECRHGGRDELGMRNGSRGNIRRTLEKSSLTCIGCEGGENYKLSVHKSQGSGLLVSNVTDNMCCIFLC